MEAKKWTLKKHFKGLPRLDDFELVTEKLPELQEGEILTQAEWLSVDPYMRGFATMMQLGQTMPGHQVARVIRSRDSEFPEGTKVVGSFGWRDVTIFKPGTPEEQDFETIYKLPDLGGLPESYALGVLGMPGNTAYFGYTRICDPKAGETLVVSTAAGAVGSIVGQIGKILGQRVLGFAGTDEKVRWLKDDLGFDEAFNYKSVDLTETFDKHAPKGIDCYFDNVGGEFTYHVTKKMNQGGRISLCGAISVYNNEMSNALVPFDYFSFIYKGLTMRGFMVYQWKKKMLDAIRQLRDWILEGKLKVRETVNEGFEAMPQAFIDMLEGKNIGKQIIKAL